MERVTINVNGASYPLAQNQDLDRIWSDIVAGVRSGGDFVKVIVHGNRELTILVSPGLSLTFDTQEVPDDARDDGNVGYPFDPSTTMTSDYFADL